MDNLMVKENSHTMLLNLMILKNIAVHGSMVSHQVLEKLSIIMVIFIKETSKRVSDVEWELIILTKSTNTLATGNRIRFGGKGNSIEMIKFFFKACLRRD